MGQAAKPFTESTGVSICKTSRATTCKLDSVDDQQHVNIDTLDSVPEGGCYEQSDLNSDNCNDDGVTVDDIEHGEDNMGMNYIQECESNEKEFIQKINDSMRNRAYTKVVHDTRNGQSKVYGMTDDIVVSHDVLNKTYNTWAIHDKEQDERCEEIIQLITRWPSACPKQCKDGIDMINQILPDIVMQIRCHSGENDIK